VLTCWKHYNAERLVNVCICIVTLYHDLSLNGVLGNVSLQHVVEGSPGGATLINPPFVFPFRSGKTLWSLISTSISSSPAARTCGRNPDRNLGSVLASIFQFLMDNSPPILLKYYRASQRATHKFMRNWLSRPSLTCPGDDSVFRSRMLRWKLPKAA